LKLEFGTLVSALGPLFALRFLVSLHAWTPTKSRMAGMRMSQCVQLYESSAAVSSSGKHGPVRTVSAKSEPDLSST
jgi:hypothetical protein